VTKPVTNTLETVAAPRSKVNADLLFRNLTRLAAGLTFLIVIAILISLAYGAAPALHKFGLGFLFSTHWNPVTEQFGGAPAVMGTLITSLLALIMAVPISFGIALYINELAPPWLKRPISTAIALLAAIPSIIYGMW